jgi:origin recognition complex (ORC) subunit 2
MTILSLDRSRATAYFDFHSNKTRVDVSEKNANSALLNFKKLDPPDSSHITHPTEMLALHTRLRSLFPEFKIQLMAGFKLILYGYGTKMALLDEFVKEFMSDIDTYTIYAHKRDKIVLPERFLKPTGFIVHNLHLLENKERYLQDPMLHLIGTVNQEIVLGKDIIYHDFTTMHPYTFEELQVVDPSAIHPNSTDSSRAAEGAAFVLGSVTENARGIFKLLARMQLEYTSFDDIDDHEKPFALPTHILFQRASEQLLVSNEASFRTILAEFIDHELVIESGEGLCIPLSREELYNLMNI